jgi:DNA-directed RNA polymerase subunit M/transcription elongation factor TFIIS
MSKHDLDCPECGSSMIKSYEREAKFRLKLIVWNQKGMFAVCKGCNHEVEITPDLMKSIQSSFVYEITGKGLS